MRPDRDLLGLDISAALAGGDRRLLPDAAVAASLRLEEQGVGPHPVRFLAGYVRAAGRAAALALPQPLVGEIPQRLVRRWLIASRAAGSNGTGGDGIGGDGIGGDGIGGDGIDGDLIFARWLEMVAALIAARRA